MHGMIQQMPGQARIRLVRGKRPSATCSSSQAQVQAARGQFVAAESMPTPGTPQGIRAVDQAQHGPRQAHGAPRQTVSSSSSHRRCKCARALLMSGLR